MSTRISRLLVLLVCALPLFAQQGTRYKVAGKHHITLPAGWKVSSQTPNALEAFVPLSHERKPLPSHEDDEGKSGGRVTAEATLLVVVETRRNHDEALRRLEEIAAEQPEEAHKLLIAGWPAIERVYRDPLPLSGDDERTGAPETTFVTTAIAAGDSLVRLETTLQPDADRGIADDSLRIGRSYEPPAAGRTATSQWELDHLHVRFEKAELAQSRTIASVAATSATPAAAAGTAAPTQTGRGELEIAVTPDGKNVVVGANKRFSHSSDSGATWTTTEGTPCNQLSCDGDPSLAIGQSAAMYFAWIGGPAKTQRGNGLSRSTDNGATFPFRAMSVNCPGSSACQLADQEHIAADRFNAGASGDRVYNVWRNFTGPTTLSSIRIVCSSDGGATWGTQLVIGAGDFPRVAVGPDSFVYVASRSGANMMLTKFAACDASNNLAIQTGFPVTVASFVTVDCPVPGLDRCNEVNLLSSPTVAPDDLDASHIYYGFATHTAPNNEDVILRDSSDGGATFPRSVRVNANVAGRRFMPWVTAYGGVAALSWYDRRNATAAQNDATRFYIAAAKPNGPNLVALSETDLSGVNDLQCSTWPCSPRSEDDSTFCSVQPQLAGVCSVTTTMRCDFNLSNCPSGETCDTGSGCPKYGDYSGNASAAGRLYSAWASAVPPTGATAPGPGINVYNSVDGIASDFFIRDWTVSATSRDGGNQPSTHTTFWTSSDVWNQSTNTPAPLVNDWIAGDSPTRGGPNFAFARVARRAPARTGAPAAAVTVRFGFADFGSGGVYTDLGTETVTFAAGDMTKFTPAHSWSVPLTASGHVCLIAQLSAPDGDSFAPPSLIGNAPAAGVIVADNNKAQRNLSVLDVAPGGEAEVFAIVRNDQRERRPIRLLVKASEAVAARVAVAGGTRATIQDGMIVDVGELAPGERRWLQVHFTDVTKEVRVNFTDVASGFTIAARRAPLDVVAANNLRAFADVLLRIAALEQNDLAKSEAEAAFGAAKDSLLARYVLTHLEALEKIATRTSSDPVGIREAFELLRRASDTTTAASALNALTERLDMDATLRR